MKSYAKYLIWAAVAVIVAGAVFLVLRPATPAAPTGVADVGNADFQKAITAGAQLIDVRTAEEYAAGHIPGAINIPIDVLPKMLATIDKTRTVAVYCATGARSLNAKQFLAAQGYPNVLNLQSGIASWDGQVIAGTKPGTAGQGASGSPAPSGAAVTIKTNGTPVFVDLFSPT
jgi:rhodanese-related sulfurtransferase